MLFFSRAVVDDGLFFFSQFPEWNICPHTHGPADVGHQRPHKRIPGSNGSLVNGQGLVRYKGRAVYILYHSCTPAGAAGSLAVKGQFFR